MLFNEKLYDAKVKLAKTLVLSPHYSKAHYLYARVWELENNFEKATLHYQSSIEHFKDNPLAFFHLGKLQFENGDFNRSRKQSQAID